MTANQNTQQKITIGHGRNGDIVAHAAGCRDIARSVKHHWTITAATYEDVAADAYCDQIDGGECTLKDALDDIHFLPCCNLVHAVQS